MFLENINVYTISIIFSIIFLVLVVRLVNKKKLQEKYSLIWIITSTTILILSSTPNIINKISLWLGIKNPPSFLFLFGLISVIVYNLYLTVLISKQAEKITRLSQEIALIKQEIGQSRLFSKR
ncbi:hypothetical protein Sgly_1879 [Syntrophobotulus glycolicus DSM 8271]|uniref:DUF2304 domain-containing protein n=1 Tax=Syntrophobotulus glycolicus (strain DSM 8271 / FlGlyR) TaxID=645991 RepID=F0T089_SYNGF|nr:DUF2304 domain-containing protein [Syntrophobotulus glycolicus]ADY56176.1 hypothetical protein Sgly_1879 [Syntrophobotulus glycolicus DSM 8271]